MPLGPEIVPALNTVTAASLPEISRPYFCEFTIVPLVTV
jgi:hypothetical protein